jgi:hypothetical protein
MKDILISLILSGHPEQYPEYTSYYEACAPELTYFTSTTNQSTQVVILVEVVNLFTKQL